MKNLSTLIRSFFTSRANPKDLGRLVTKKKRVSKPKRRRRKRRPRKTCILCNRNSYHIHISTKGIFFKKGKTILMSFTRTGKVTINNEVLEWPFAGISFERQGGDPDDWSAYGTTNYTPNALKMQAGVYRYLISGETRGAVSFPMPVAFAASPIGVFATVTNTSESTALIDRFNVNGQPVAGYPQTITLRWAHIDPTDTTYTYTYIDIAWMAIGYV